MYGFNPVNLANTNSNNSNSNRNNDHSSTGGGSALDTLSVFTPHDASAAPNPRRLTEMDVTTPSTGILKFPPPQGSVA